MVNGSPTDAISITPNIVAYRGLKDLNGRELTALLPLVAIVVWLGIYPKPILKPIDNSVQKLLTDMEYKARTPEAKKRIISIQRAKEEK